MSRCLLVRSHWILLGIGKIIDTKLRAYRLVAGEDEVLDLRLLFLAKGTVEVTMLPAQKFLKHRILAMRELKVAMEDFFLTEGLNRMQANSPDESRFRRFMGHLGFKPEATMQKFNDSKDYVLWAYFGGA